MRIRTIIKIKNKDTVLQYITGYLKRIGISLSSVSADGRVNSSKNEDEVMAEIKKLFDSDDAFIKNLGLKLIVPKERYWYDFAVKSDKDKDFFIPVNIKVSALSSTDNTQCKVGMLYAISGRVPEEHELSKLTKHEYFHKALKKAVESPKSQNEDYYFLIVNLPT